MSAEPTIREQGPLREASASEASATLTGDLEAARLRREGWPPESVESYGKFGTRGSLLYPYIDLPNGIRTPMGPGTLLQAFEDTAGRPGAMVAHLRPRAWIKEKGGRRAAAVFVPLEDVQPHGRGRDP